MRVVVVTFVQDMACLIVCDWLIAILLAALSVFIAVRTPAVLDFVLCWVLPAVLCAPVSLLLFGRV